MIVAFFRWIEWGFLYSFADTCLELVCVCVCVCVCVWVCVCVFMYYTPKCPTPPGVYKIHTHTHTHTHTDSGVLECCYQLWQGAADLEPRKNEHARGAKGV